MTAVECLAALAEYRQTDRCRRCEYLDWAIAQLQQVGDYALACEAVALRAPRDRIVPEAGCHPCAPLDRYFGWLRSPQPGARAQE
jgi:hypothetical protein